MNKEKIKIIPEKIIKQTHDNPKVVEELTENPQNIITDAFGHEIINGRKVKVYFAAPLHKHVGIIYDKATDKEKAKQETANAFDKLLAKAHDDKKIEQELFSADCSALLRDKAINIPEGLQVTMVRNTPEQFNFIVPVKEENRELSTEELDDVAGGFMFTTLGLIGAALSSSAAAGFAGTLAGGLADLGVGIAAGHAISKAGK